MSYQETQTLAEIAATSLAAVNILERHGLDYCCGGKQPLADACRTKGVSPTTLIAELERASAASPASAADWTTAPLKDLIHHIVTTHHEYLKLEMPTLEQRARKVASVHGGKAGDRSRELLEVFSGVKAEMDEHMHKEEAILFPVMERFEAALKQGAPMFLPFGSFANPLSVMEHEHDSAGEALRAMREITNNYTLPPHACTTYRNLYEGLQAFEADLHRHIHLENNILHPRAKQMEEQARQHA